MEVMLPTGSSAGAAKVRASVSASRQKNAPKKIEKVKTVRLLLPKISRTMCGMMRPTNPITPQQATVAAMSSDAAMSTVSVVR